VRLARDRGFQVLRSFADRQSGRRIADLLEILEVPVRMAGFAFGGRAKNGGHVVESLHVGLPGEIEVAAIRLRFAGKRVLEVLLRLAALQIGHE
jgi:hypothetical protein